MFFKWVKLRPEDEKAFKHDLSQINKSRTKVLACVDLFFPLMMFFAQWNSAKNNPDPVMRDRSVFVFQYAKIWLIISVVFFSLYWLAVWKKASDRAFSALSYLFFITNMVWGASANILVFLVDGIDMVSYYIMFTFLSCLIILIKPIYSACILVVVMIGSVLACKYLPVMLGLAGADSFSWSLLVETKVSTVIVAFIISTVLYYHFMRDFNKTYTIEKLNKELSWLVKIDPLTQIYNRKEFTGRLKQQAKEMAATEQWLSVAILDIDYFKQFNDTYGHLVGDDCLKSVAQSLWDTVGAQAPDAIVARYGGEEFTIAIPSLAPDQALLVFEKAFSAVKELKIEHSASLVASVITVSLGACSVMPPQDYDVSVLLRCADELLYEVKNTGRNRVAFKCIH